MILFNFNTKSNITNWNVISDVVMGGRSNGSFNINKKGFGVFEGYVSLENNGGFSMIQYKFDNKKVNSFNKFCIRLKGDGKNYQFRVKTNNGDQHSYVIPFKTLMSFHLKLIQNGKLLKFHLKACILRFVAEN